MKINEPIDYFKQGYFHEWFFLSFLSLFQIFHPFLGFLFNLLTSMWSPIVVFTFTDFVFYFVQRSANESKKINQKINLQRKMSEKQDLFPPMNF